MIYTAEQIKWLRKHRASATITVITAAFNAKFDTLVSKKALAATCKRHKIKAGSNGQFAAGRIPHNKGKKGWTSEACKATAFKPGQKSANVKPVGHERVGKDGYIQIKTADGFRQYRQKHRVIWEQHHGPIPPKHKIVFLDNNTLNFDIKNLELVRNSELATLNRHENFKKLPADLKKTMIAVVRLEQQTRKANNNSTDQATQ